MTDIVNLHPGKKPGKQASSTRPEFWPIAAAQSVADAAVICQDRDFIGLVTGPSGSGKTTAARQAVRDANEDAFDEAVYLSMTLAAEGLQPGLLRIANAVSANCSPHAGSNDLHDALVQHPWPEGTILVLDEAQFMSDALLHGLRNVWDELSQRHRGIGVLLLGTPELADRIEGRITRKSKPFEPLRGRLGVAVQIGRPDDDDYAAICNHLGVVGSQAQAIVAKVGSAAGGLHNLRRLLDIAKGNGKTGEIGLSDLKRAASAMGVRS